VADSDSHSMEIARQAESDSALARLSRLELDCFMQGCGQGPRLAPSHVAALERCGAIWRSVAGRSWFFQSLGKLFVALGH